jgi:hypothetical protein
MSSNIGVIKNTLKESTRLINTKAKIFLMIPLI